MATTLEVKSTSVTMEVRQGPPGKSLSGLTALPGFSQIFFSPDAPTQEDKDRVTSALHISEDQIIWAQLVIGDPLVPQRGVSITEGSKVTLQVERPFIVEHGVSSVVGDIQTLVFAGDVLHVQTGVTSTDGKISQIVFAGGTLVVKSGVTDTVGKIQTLSDDSLLYLVSTAGDSDTEGTISTTTFAGGTFTVETGDSFNEGTIQTIVLSGGALTVQRGDSVTTGQQNIITFSGGGLIVKSGTSTTVGSISTATQEEQGVTPFSVSDSVNRTDGVLGSNWTTVTGANNPVISGNGVVNSNSPVGGGIKSMACWTANGVFGDDQSSSCKCAPIETTFNGGATARQSLTNKDVGYALIRNSYFDGGEEVWIEGVDLYRNGVPVKTFTEVPLYLKLTASGSDVTCQQSSNGTSWTTMTDGVYTDATPLTGGYAGIQKSDVASKLDDWAGASL